MKPFIKSVFVGTTLALCLAATSTSLDILVEPSDSLVVPKTVVSSNLRFIYAVGVEGTGHHYFIDVENHMFKKNTELVRIPARDILDGESLCNIHFSMGGDVEHYITTLSSARQSMRKLARRGETIKRPGTVVSMEGRNSYPNGHGPNKALKYYDLRMLAEAAEAEGVDFRVLYLKRQAKDLLIANTMHRKFHNRLGNEGSPTPQEKFMQYMQILFTDIAVMHSFLVELGPGFVVCHDFDRLGDVDQSAAISEFLAPNADFAAMLNSSFVEVAGTGHGPSKETLLYQGADVVAARFQRKFDVFESRLCSGTEV